MCSKRDYVAIAKAIRNAITEDERACKAHGTKFTALGIVENIAQVCADHFAQHSSSFNRQRFLIACGVPVHDTTFRQPASCKPEEGAKLVALEDARKIVQDATHNTLNTAYIVRSVIVNAELSSEVADLLKECQQFLWPHVSEVVNGVRTLRDDDAPVVEMYRRLIKATASCVQMKTTDEKRISLKEWDRASTEKRAEWLRDGYLIPREEAEELRARYIKPMKEDK